MKKIRNKERKEGRKSRKYLPVLTGSEESSWKSGSKCGGQWESFIFHHFKNGGAHNKQNKTKKRRRRISFN